MNKTNIFTLAAMLSLITAATSFGQTVEDSANTTLSATIQEPDPFISVTGSATFGTISVPDSDRTLHGATGTLVSWRAPNGSDWSIHVTANNTTGQLVDGNGNGLQLKFNNPNLGIPDYLDDPAVGTAPTKDEFGDENLAIYRPVLGSGASNADKTLLEFGGNTVEGKELAGAAADVPLNFAIAVPSSAPGGAYSATVTLDLVIDPVIQ